MSSNSSNTVSTTDILTYRLNRNMVYVTPPRDMEQALEFARTVFPDELADVDRTRISFSVTVISGGRISAVGISPFAWSAIVPHLIRYEVIDVHVRRDNDAPPEYSHRESKRSSEKTPISYSPIPMQARARSCYRRLTTLGRNEKSREKATPLHWFQRFQ
ncbi:hypothetical protein SERLA73DRAFT_167150 [Serpula lacrymans var. lacrymans S7.3]|uniref:Uncharacterized protein n=2 Tax=Serpula lacrymans var. lacrymans TaxID=341189 RepID=F8PTB6_SERL3|nr:uncharacterized protein SERLADRAFT_463759 [Serpula lacrymans var. lacrymans S7.9]EGO00946.1 hypothetical protein SERLA73DRAFT_167150 [Serpula lacrymans var. lacrymans S7.3]EGO26565.1 hypothetical protein SERLADRAFT_463759 [Serpula lacrymans var. lacrymans S7.9]